MNPALALLASVVPRLPSLQDLRTWLTGHWTAVLIVLSVWTVFGLRAVARTCSRTWFRPIAVFTVLLDIAVLLHTNALLAAGELMFGAWETNVRRLPLAPGALAFWAFLALLLVLYRRLEILNAQRTLADLAVETLTDDEGQRHAGMEALLRDAINRHSPHFQSRFPGVGVEYLRDYLEKQPSDSERWYARAAAAVLHVAFPSRTLGVTAALVPAKGDEPNGVAVTVQEERTKHIVFSRVVRNASLQDAVEEAGYLVAEVAIRRCPTLPKWAYWNKEGEASPFLDYWKGIREGKRGPESLRQAKERLEHAAELAPESVLPRLQLAAVLEALHEYLEAVEIYATVVDRYPFLFDARYRLAILLSEADYWLDASFVRNEPRLERLAQALARPLRGTSDADFPRRKNGESAETYSRTVKAYLFRESSGMQERLSDDFGWFHLARRSVRTAERRYLWRYLWNRSRRRAGRAAMRTARCHIELLSDALMNGGAPCQRTMDEQTKEALRAVRIFSRRTRSTTAASAREKPSGWRTRRSWRSAEKRAEKGWWGLPHYNVACLYAVLLDPRILKARGIDTDGQQRMVEEAVRHLEIATRDPEGPLAPRSLWWIMLQDDLDLRHLVKYQRFRNWQHRCRLRIGTERDDGLRGWWRRKRAAHASPPWRDAPLAWLAGLARAVFSSPSRRPA